MPSGMPWVLASACVVGWVSWIGPYLESSSWASSFETGPPPTRLRTTEPDPIDKPVSAFCRMYSRRASACSVRIFLSSTIRSRPPSIACVAASMVCNMLACFVIDWARNVRGIAQERMGVCVCRGGPWQCTPQTDQRHCARILLVARRFGLLIG